MLSAYLDALPGMATFRAAGRVQALTGLLISSDGPAAAVGDFCEIRSDGGRSVRAQVVGFRDGRVLLMPLEETGGIAVRRYGGRARGGGQGRGGAGAAGPRAGRIRKADGRTGRRSTRNVLRFVRRRRRGRCEREHITEPLVTGIRAIDGLLPCGKGQRVGIFGGSGVGKSTLLGAMSRHNSAPT